MNITKNFTFAEFEASTKAKEKGILNVITSFEVRDAVVALCKNLLQPLRDLYKKPMKINSGYRNAALNNAVDGERTSQHCLGEAADISTGSQAESYRLAKIAIENNLSYDQLILYPTFVHFSHKKNGKQRGQILYNKSYKGRRF